MYSIPLRVALWSDSRRRNAVFHTFTQCRARTARTHNYVQHYHGQYHADSVKFYQRKPMDVTISMTPAGKVIIYIYINGISVLKLKLERG